MLMLFRAYLAQRGAVRSFAAILFSFGEANFKQKKGGKKCLRERKREATTVLDRHLPNSVTHRLDVPPKLL